MSDLPSPSLRAFFAVVTTAVACACFLEPGAGLRGQWGGHLIVMDARPSEVRLYFVCVTAVAPELLIDGSGRFGGTAQGTGYWAPMQLRLSGKLENAVMMSLDVTSVWPPHGAQTDTLFTHESYTLVRGAAGDFSGWDCIQ
jgi:hypothetical protein